MKGRWGVGGVEYRGAGLLPTCQCPLAERSRQRNDSRLLPTVRLQKPITRPSPKTWPSEKPQSTCRSPIPASASTSRRSGIRSPLPNFYQWTPYQWTPSQLLPGTYPESPSSLRTLYGKKHRNAFNSCIPTLPNTPQYPPHPSLW